MIIIKKGDILKATENIICHQCNEDGIMGGGLAYQIANQYPKVEMKYKKLVNKYQREGYDLYGCWQLCNIDKTKYIINCFTQQNFNTRYDLIKSVFEKIKCYAKQNNFSICIPYKIGCGIAKGEWEKVESILTDIFIDYDITIYNYN